MNWTKFPLPWQFWSGSTLLASLSLHGLLLSLPLAAEKEPPKPETLAAVPITTLPAVPTVEPSTELPEPDPTVQPPPQPPEPLFEEFEPLFDRFPSRQFSSFPDRSQWVSRQPEKRVEPVKETEDALTKWEESSDRSETPSTDVETQDENRQDKTIPDRTLEYQPSIDPRKKILLTSTPQSSEFGNSEEQEEILDDALDRADDRVEDWFARLEKNDQGELLKGEENIEDLILGFERFIDISKLKTLFFEEDTLKKEIDHQQSLFVLSSTESPININKLREYYIKPLESKGFQVKEESHSSEGKIYRVEKIGFVRYIQLYETEGLGGQLLAGVIVWKEFPGQ